jgi:hypothetical protein
VTRDEMIDRLQNVVTALANDERDFLSEGKKVSALQAGHAIEDALAVIEALKQAAVRERIVPQGEESKKEDKGP